MESQIPCLTNSEGIPLPIVSSKSYQETMAKLNSEYSISELQIVEAAAFSMAMVIRAALGYSAAEANILALITDNIESRIVLATLRHLVTSHANAEIITLCPPSEETKQQIAPLTKMGVNLTEFKSKAEASKLPEYLDDAHNVLFGLASQDTNELNNHIVSILNDNQTPIHCINCPYGVNPDDGTVTKPVLYASSTLSLGLIQSGLLTGNEYCGRNYLCDISIPQELYSEVNCPNLGLNFATQPVIRVLYKGNEEVSPPQ